MDDRQWERLLDHYGLSREDYDLSRIQNVLAESAQSEGYPYLDLLSILKKHIQVGELYYSWNQHWTAKGNSLVAESIVEWLDREDLLSGVIY